MVKSAAPRAKGGQRADPWAAAVRRLLGATRDRVRTKELLTELGVASEAQHHAARRLAPILRALGWRYMRVAEGYHWRRPVKVPPRRPKLFPSAAADGRAERDRLLWQRLRESAARWSRAELSACVEELRAEAGALAALVVEGDPLADLYRAEAGALEAAAVAVDRLDLVPAAGGILDIDRALECVAANREAAALVVEGLGATIAPFSAPRAQHARRRVLELAAMRLRERGRVEGIEQDRRRYVDRERAEVFPVRAVAIGGAT